MPKEDYYAIQAEKAARYQDLATRHGMQAEQLSERAHSMSDCIPMGQPILVGHYSEKRDRNFRARIQRTWEKSVEERDKAQYYQGKAARAEDPRAISSDAPDAIELLKEQLTKLEYLRDKAKEINKIALSRRKGYTDEQKTADLVALGMQDKTAALLLEPDFAGRIGVPSYKLTNTGAEIRRIKERIAKLEKDKESVTTERTIGDVRIVDNVEENRVQVFFPGIPTPEIRKSLKSYGFRWSPSAGCWQAYRNNRSEWALMQVLGAEGSA